MKITKYLYIYTLLLCVTAQGMTLSQICIGPDHCDSEIDWASVCHTQNQDSHASHESSFGHQESGCIDITIGSKATSGNSCYKKNPAHSAKPVILKPSAADHPFFSIDISKLKPALFPVFTDIASLSIASTILIV